MTVLLLVLTFATFIVIDLVLNRKKAPKIATEAELQPVMAESDPEVVGGFAVPSNVRYHPGHTWVQRERKNVNRVGADAFAAAFAGPVDRIELPKPGQWVRQGQKVASFIRNGEKIELVSPVEGEVVEINSTLLTNPSLLREEPYGKGWMMNVFSPDEDSPARNLLPVNLVRSWMQEAADRLFALQPQLAGATAADGGEPVADPAAALDAKTWKKAAEEFFLS
ncbi:MAG: glycine cleavage system protein H [Bryobacteraceae bacterium]|nr:glycine cleavage system protein H [Solibacteraceae bacterium]MCO5350927.1 glycine cleavage system protein H [Bryobacteraceae bacterium]